ncbi:hypothetical protein NU08_1992 [Flavobacterium anhuiense]|uniref:Uncharacterized protein n=1 Tax=Flavobacterium anhuiense TaxID=459526 RepID=A0A444W044_9FLAO|nr:hypothetical protein NU08_1992 [Flavobacterium anhuiense]
MLILINLKLNISSKFIVIRIEQKVSEFTAKKSTSFLTLMLFQD